MDDLAPPDSNEFLLIVAFKPFHHKNICQDDLKNAVKNPVLLPLNSKTLDGKITHLRSLNDNKGRFAVGTEKQVHYISRSLSSIVKSWKVPGIKNQTIYAVERYKDITLVITGHQLSAFKYYKLVWKSPQKCGVYSYTTFRTKSSVYFVNGDNALIKFDFEAFSKQEEEVLKTYGYGYQTKKIDVLPDKDDFYECSVSIDQQMKLLEFSKNKEILFQISAPDQGSIARMWVLEDQGVFLVYSCKSTGGADTKSTDFDLVLYAKMGVLDKYQSNSKGLDKLELKGSLHFGFKVRNVYFAGIYKTAAYLMFAILRHKILFLKEIGLEKDVKIMALSPRGKKMANLMITDEDSIWSLKITLS